MATWSTLAPRSSLAHPISTLFAIVMLVSAVIFVLVAGLVVYGALRYRDRGEPGEPTQIFGSRRVEVAWTAGATIVVVILFVLSVTTMQAADPAPGARPPDLDVIAHQWWWEIRYPASGVVTANEIHIPVGHRWLVRFESADVIHDFWVPPLGRKMDVVPGRQNVAWLEASAPGVYLGACAEYCGAEHAWMRIRVVAESDDAFRAWERAERAPAIVPAGGDAAAGARTFQRLPCVNCHAIAGTGADARIGPDLTHMGSRRTLAAGVLDNTPENLARWLRNPQAVKPGNRMPDMRLDDAEIRSLVAYLEALR